MKKSNNVKDVMNRLSVSLRLKGLYWYVFYTSSAFMERELNLSAKLLSFRCAGDDNIKTCIREELPVSEYVAKCLIL